MFLLSVSIKTEAQRITVQIAKKDGTAPKGMIVTVEAILLKHGDNVKIRKSETGWTDKEGRVTLIFTKDDKYWFDGKATISCGSGIFTKEERRTVSLSGIRENYYFSRRY